MVTWLKASGGGCELTLHIQPGASHTELVGEHGDALRLRLRARAVEGAANAALAEFLASHLGLPKRSVTLLRGEKSRRKTLLVQATQEQILDKLSTSPVPSSH